MVNVAPMPDLKAKWSNMVSDLNSGDINNAVNYFSLSSRTSYQKAFQALLDAGVLSQATAGMGNMSIVKSMGNAAEGDLSVIKNGKEYSYYVLFVKDEDGIWRIKAF